MAAKVATKTEPKTKSETKAKKALVTEVKAEPAKVAAAPKAETPGSVADLKAEYSKYLLDFRLNKQKDSSKLSKLRKQIAQALTLQNSTSK